MPNLYPVARPIFGLLRPERARDLTILSLKFGLGGLMADRAAQNPDPDILAQSIWGLTFSNPVGLAAGFDKDARIPDEVIKRWRFGFVEVGTVTPLPQEGNEKPRVFRLREDGAIINRMGFNSMGLPTVLQRLQKRLGRPGIVGLNLGKNRNSIDASADYEIGIRSAASLVSYLVINVSSPNTPGLRDLQRRVPFEKLLSTLLAARDSVNPNTPLLVKIAPDLSDEECDDIGIASLKLGINGIIVSNTTLDRPTDLISDQRGEAGGLSGKPLFERSTRMLARVYKSTNGGLPLIGVGGIESAADAYEKICAGASLIQLYTALAFQGPMLVTEIKQGLAALLKAKGFSSIQQAVGSRSAEWIAMPLRSESRVNSIEALDTRTTHMSSTRGLSSEPWPLSST